MQSWTGVDHEKGEITGRRLPRLGGDRGLGPGAAREDGGLGKGHPAHHHRREPWYGRDAISHIMFSGPLSFFPMVLPGKIPGNANRYTVWSVLLLSDVPSPWRCYPIDPRSRRIVHAMHHYPHPSPSAQSCDPDIFTPRTGYF